MPLVSIDYKKRAELLQAEMTARQLDGLLIYGWKRGQIKYYSGYYPNYQANVALVVAPAIGEPAMRIRFPFDLERARKESWIDDIGASGNLSALAEQCKEIFHQRHLSRGRIGLVTGDNIIEEMPRSLFTHLTVELPEVTWVEASDLFQKYRLIKTEAEFQAIRESAYLADLGAEAARSVIQAGRTEYEVVAAAESAMRQKGADAHLVTIASKGVSELIGPPEAKVLENGDNVIFEIAVQKAGYWSQAAHVFYVGGPDEAQTRLYKDTYQTYLQATKMIHPGITCREIAEAIEKTLIQAGYGEGIEQDFGHGIGLDLPEPPRIEFKDDTCIQAGMVLVIHPAVRIPGIGGAFLGGTVLVHSDSAELLHHIPEQPRRGST